MSSSTNNLVEVDPRRRSILTAKKSALILKQQQQPPPDSQDNLVFSVPIDPKLIDTIEVKALELAKDLDRVISNFEAKMQEMTKYALESVEIHNSAVQGLCSTLDHSRAEMLALITAVDQLSEDMGGVVALSSQIKVLKEALDLIEKLPAVKG
ncbi:UNVERIFIED_CONTAM: hypothetical protein HDU68_000428 [Siphonaria sp. JEL0065]|nr:hypothetical protein HDU68_000428 [Siphonaria sp. JEL0065]